MTWRTPLTHFFFHPIGQAFDPQPAPKRQGSSTPKAKRSHYQLLSSIYSIGKGHRKNQDGSSDPWFPTPSPWLGPWPMLHQACPNPKYLAGFNDGQAEGHVSLWDSRASMSLLRSVCKLAPATKNENRRGNQERTIPCTLVSFTYKQGSPNQFQEKTHASPPVRRGWSDGSCGLKQSKKPHPCTSLMEAI